MDPGKKRRKNATPKDKRSRHDIYDRLTNSGKIYPSHKSVTLEMLGYEEEGNSYLDCETPIPFSPPATSMDVDEPILSKNALRQQRKLNRRRIAFFVQ